MDSKSLEETPTLVGASIRSIVEEEAHLDPPTLSKNPSKLHFKSSEDPERDYTTLNELEHEGALTNEDQVYDQLLDDVGKLKEVVPHDAAIPIEEEPTTETTEATETSANPSKSSSKKKRSKKKKKKTTSVTQTIEKVEEDKFGADNEVVVVDIVKKEEPKVAETSSTIYEVASKTKADDISLEDLIDSQIASISEFSTDLKTKKSKKKKSKKKSPSPSDKPVPEALPEHAIASDVAQVVPAGVPEGVFSPLVQSRSQSTVRSPNQDSLPEKPHLAKGNSYKGTTEFSTTKADLEKVSSKISSELRAGRRPVRDDLARVANSSDYLRSLSRSRTRMPSVEAIKTVNDLAGEGVLLNDTEYHYSIDNAIDLKVVQEDLEEDVDDTIVVEKEAESAEEPKEETVQDSVEAITSQESAVSDEAEAEAELNEAPAAEETEDPIVEETGPAVEEPKEAETVENEPVAEVEPSEEAIESETVEKSAADTENLEEPIAEEEIVTDSGKVVQTETTEDKEAEIEQVTTEKAEKEEAETEESEKVEEVKKVVIETNKDDTEVTNDVEVHRIEAVEDEVKVDETEDIIANEEATEDLPVDESKEEEEVAPTTKEFEAESKEAENVETEENIPTEEIDIAEDELESVTKGTAEINLDDETDKLIKELEDHIVSSEVETKADESEETEAKADEIEEIEGTNDLEIKKDTEPEVETKKDSSEPTEDKEEETAKEVVPESESVVEEEEELHEPTKEEIIEMLKDEPVYLYTSLAGGGFHMPQRTNKLVTILTANRIPFTYRDLGTDDEARGVWRRYSNGRMLPGIVRGKDDIIGNWEEIEEANEDYRVRELIYETL